MINTYCPRGSTHTHTASGGSDMRMKLKALEWNFEIIPTVFLFLVLLFIAMELLS